MNHLTQRQMEVVKLVSRGLSNKEIGAILGITTSTVKKHIQQIMNTVDVRGRAGIVAWCFKRGVLRPEDL